MPLPTIDIDIEKALRLNRKYSQRLNWTPHYNLISNYLGFENFTPNEITFAYAIAQWQSFHFRDPDDIDGIIGPGTWGKLKQFVIPQRIDNWKSLRLKMVEVAQKEHAFWGYGTKKETDPKMATRLLSYYKKGANKNPETMAEWKVYASYVKKMKKAKKKPLSLNRWRKKLKNTDKANTVNWKTQIAWSAAFISYVIRQAGGGTDFLYFTRHWEYVVAAKTNRKKLDTSNPFWAYGIKEVLPAPGDIICNVRAKSKFNYRNIEKAGSKSSHCDIITEVHAGHMFAIGGNTSDSSRKGLKADTVGKKRIKLDSNGFVKGRRFYAIIKVGHGPKF